MLVYLTLHRLRYQPKKGLKPPRPDDTLGLESLVESTCDAVGSEPHLSFLSPLALRSTRLKISLHVHRRLTLRPRRVPHPGATNYAASPPDIAVCLEFRKSV